MTTTTTTKDRNGILGHAVYFELRSDDQPGMVSQFILIQETVSPVNGKTVPFQVMTRIVTEGNPQRVWRNGIAENTDSQAVVTGKKELLRDGSLEKGLDTANEYFSRIVNALDATLGNSWKFYKFPLVLELGAADVEKIQVVQTPRGLMDRLMRLRAAEGFEPLPGKKA